MNTYNIKEIKDSSFFSDNVYIDTKFLLLIPETPMTPELKSIILDWDFNMISSNGTPQANFKITETESATAENEAKDPIAGVAEKQRANESQKKQLEQIGIVEKQYKDFLIFIKKIYDGQRQGISLNPRLISDTAKEICAFVGKNKKLVLCIPAERFSEVFNFIIIHSLRSTIFSVIIGLQLKLSSFKLIELATACLIHEIGMTKIPPAIYMNKGALKPEEKQLMLAHPVLSYNLVKAASFPLQVCLGCLEHHERENGSGYPRRLHGNRISLYGKIIAVACSFEAATGVRPYKQERNSSDALIELIKNEHKQYDDKILRAILYSLSFFPIGAFVVLSDGRMAQVVDVNPDDPRYPIVQVYGERKKDGSPNILGTSKTGISITRAVNKEELQAMRQNEVK
ncbi:MAG: phosphohydrolase [Treponema sp.]|nr:MAG: phosphohydrolase [Treponema sp.]